MFVLICMVKFLFKKINIICGHYGTGKTNFTLNAALFLAKRGEKVTVVDLDIVNPYFRSSDYAKGLLDYGIKLLVPGTANTTLDAPSLPGDIYSVFSDRDSFIFFDVGGDDAGAYALGRYADMIIDSGDYMAAFVINKYRRLIESAGDAVSLMREIENASHIKMTALVNNSHLSYNTSVSDILSAHEYAREVAALSGLPLAATAVPAKFADELEGRIENIFPVDVIVKLPWN